MEPNFSDYSCQVIPNIICLPFKHLFCHYKVKKRVMCIARIDLFTIQTSYALIAGLILCLQIPFLLLCCLHYNLAMQSINSQRRIGAKFAFFNSLFDSKFPILTCNLAEYQVVRLSPKPLSFCKCATSLSYLFFCGSNMAV